MGQYWNPAILADSRDENGHEQVKFAFYSHDFGNGLKLMEHSWVGNEFVAVVAAFLSWPRRLVWAGDYADPEPGRKYVDGDDEYDATIYNLRPTPATRPMIIGEDGEPAVGVEPYGENARCGGTYSADEVNVEVTVDLRKSLRYFINHDKREFVDIKACPAFTPSWAPRESMTVHPLPLLTSEGNGRGGGDYGDEFPGQEFVGRWARDHISASNKAPRGGFFEIRPGFSEDPVLSKNTQVAQ